MSPSYYKRRKERLLRASRAGIERMMEKFVKRESDNMGKKLKKGKKMKKGGKDKKGKRK
ncbi:MAG: hypothetical protein WC551_12930 [Patescibacteria group bacterium]